MPFLIDGNNLLYALQNAGIDVGRGGLCNLLVKALPREQVCVIFDGPPPTAATHEQMLQTGVEVIFSGRRSADDLVMERIAACSAPRRLVVVSTDHEIRAAAQHRRCIVSRSEEFSQKLKGLLERVQRPPVQTEPPQKRAGLTAEETSAWLREFGIKEPLDDDDSLME